MFAKYCYLNERTFNHAVYDYALKNIDHATYHLTCSHDQTIVSLLAVGVCEFKTFIICNAIT